MDHDGQDLARAEALVELGRHEEAEQRYRSLLAHDPGLVDAMLGLSQVLILQRRFTEAEHTAAESVALAPDAAMAHYLHSAASMETGQLDGALRSARTCAELAPHWAPARTQIACVLLAMPGAHADRALAHADRGVELDPHDADAVNTRGVCLDRLGRRADADEAFRRALALDPTHVEAQRNVATAALVRGRLAEGVRGVSTAAALDPQDGRSQEVLDAAAGSIVNRWLLYLMSVALILGVLGRSESTHGWRVGIGLGSLVLLGLRTERVRRQYPRRSLGLSRLVRGPDTSMRTDVVMVVVLLALVLCLTFAPPELAASVGLAAVQMLTAIAGLGLLGLAVGLFIRAFDPERQ